MCRVFLMIAMAAWCQLAQAQGCAVLPFYEQPLGTTGAPQSAAGLLLYAGSQPVTVASVSFEASDVCPDTALPGEFVVTGDCVVGKVLQDGDRCNLIAAFAPKLEGGRFMSAIVVFSNGERRNLGFSGVGVATSFARPTMPVVEFVNPLLRQYVLATQAEEINALDSGKVPGWVRSGEQFNAFRSGYVSMSTFDVCRWYARTPVASTHWYFFTNYKCGLIEFSMYHESLVEMVQEDAAAFAGAYVSSEGWCVYGSRPLYALWDGVIGHRYTPSIAIRNEMVAQGWISEGWGPHGAIACAALN